MLTWVKTNSGNPLPANAILAGINEDGSPIHIGRDIANAEFIPGKIVDKILVVGTSWQEFELTEYEILCGTGARWIQYDGIVPPNAVQGGNRVNNEPLMIVRTSFKGALIVGKLHAYDQTAYFPHGGVETVVEDCEILVKC